MGHEKTVPHHAAGAGSTRGATALPAVDAREIPPEERVLDPRAIALASRAAGRNASLWWVAAGVVVATGTALVFGATWGARVLALLLAVGAMARAVMPAPGPAAFVVRARALDVLVLFALALGVAVLAQVIPVS